MELGRAGSARRDRHLRRSLRPRSIRAGAARRSSANDLDRPRPRARRGLSGGWSSGPRCGRGRVCRCGSRGARIWCARFVVVPPVSPRCYGPCTRWRRDARGSCWCCRFSLHLVPLRDDLYARLPSCIKRGGRLSSRGQARCVRCRGRARGGRRGGRTHGWCRSRPPEPPARFVQLRQRGAED